jgi:oligogalacturonide lyase
MISPACYDAVMASPWSRRAFVCALPAIASAQQAVPSEQKKYRDSATELELTRLTDPSASSCFLPPPPKRAVSQRNNSLLYCSDRGGKLQIYRMDLKTGESRQITSANALDASTVSSMPDDRSVCFCDGESVVVSAGRPRTVYAPEEGWARAGAFCIAEDGNHAVLTEQKNDRFRVRLVSLARPSAATIAESNVPVTLVAPRPKRAGVLYARQDGLWLVNYDGQQNRKLKTEEGEIVYALWSGRGDSIFYIRKPPGGGLHEMREAIPDSNQDKLVAPTTQFVSFSRNSDASVFVGVSGSKASPYILLLLRIARRELTVAEHRATDAAAVTVQFSPNSQRLFYQTDREGKPAIYCIALERFVERTELSTIAYSIQARTS